MIMNFYCKYKFRSLEQTLKLACRGAYKNSFLLVTPWLFQLQSPSHEILVVQSPRNSMLYNATSRWKRLSFYQVARFYEFLTSGCSIRCVGNQKRTVSTSLLIRNREKFPSFSKSSYASGQKRYHEHLVKQVRTILRKIFEIFILVRFQQPL